MFRLPAATCGNPAWRASQPRQQPRASRLLTAPGRGLARRLAVHDGSGSGADDDLTGAFDEELPPAPIPPDLTGLTVQGLYDRVKRFMAEQEAWELAVQRHKARQQARRAAGVPPPPSPAAAWPAVTESTLPAANIARAAAAEAMATAAVAFADGAVGHEAAAEAAHAAAARQPAASLVAAGEHWLRAGMAWRKAFDSLEAARHAQPGADVVREAAAQVEAAHRFKRQLRGLRGQVAADEDKDV